MASVIGVGGVFFKCADPERTRAWYRDALGLAINDYGGADFEHAETARRFGPGARTIWSPFEAGADYFSPSRENFMINLIVDDLDGVLARLEAVGTPLEGEPQDFDYGRFAWVMDPDGVKIELWQPAGG